MWRVTTAAGRDKIVTLLLFSCKRGDSQKTEKVAVGADLCI